MIKARAQRADARLQQALLVLRGVVLEVLRQVPVFACRLDRLDRGRTFRPFELGKLGGERVALARRELVDFGLVHARSIGRQPGGDASRTQPDVDRRWADRSSRCRSTWLSHSASRSARPPRTSTPRTDAPGGRRADATGWRASRSPMN